MTNITNNPEQKKSVDNIIFLSDKINERAGGPSGYIANLQNGLTLFDDHSAKIAVVGDIYQPQESRIKKSLLKLLTFWVPCKKWRRDLRSRLDSVLFEQADKYAQRGLILFCLNKRINMHNMKKNWISMISCQSRVIRLMMFYL